MIFVIQRVSSASVSVGGEEVSAIGRGLLVLIGVKTGDTEAEADLMVRKLLAMRIFEDEAGKTNLSLADVGGNVLAVSQFTLCADLRKGNRPSFTGAAEPGEAERLYEYILAKIRETFPCAGGGVFGADMDVSLINDGPFTVILDSDQLRRSGREAKCTG